MHHLCETSGSSVTILNRENPERPRLSYSLPANHEKFYYSRHANRRRDRLSSSASVSDPGNDNARVKMCASLAEWVGVETSNKPGTARHVALSQLCTLLVQSYSYARFSDSAAPNYYYHYYHTRITVLCGISALFFQFASSSAETTVRGTSELRLISMFTVA